MTTESQSAQLPPTGTNTASRPCKFALWELFTLTTLVCLAGAFYAWSHEEPDAIVLMIMTVLVTLVFIIHVLARAMHATFIAAGAAILFFLCLGPLPHSPDPSRRLQCSNNLQNIALAIQWYHDTYGSYPPAYIADANGKPIHSWRVLLLPFLEQKQLYAKYRFDEPWDGPNNRKLHGQVVSIYSCPSRPRTGSRLETAYVAVVGPETMWPGSTATNLGDLKDGTSSTIMVIEAVNAGIHWMEPRDLDMSTMLFEVNSKTGRGISSDHPNVALAAFADGHTSALSNKTPKDIVKALLTIAGGEVIGDY